METTDKGGQAKPEHGNVTSFNWWFFRETVMKAEKNKKASFCPFLILILPVFWGACKEHPAPQPPSRGENHIPTIKSTTQNKTESPQPASDPNKESEPNVAQWSHPRSSERLDERKWMVNRIRDVYGLHDKKILEAMLNVPRHWFVPGNMQSLAYSDRPLPIGHDQTISQPFIVAYMTSVLDLRPTNKVLEVGTGSGYQAAVLTEFTPHVFSIEILEPLADAAKTNLEKRGYTSIQVRCGDGYQGWPQYSPFDAIIVTCAPDHIPSPLLEQLKPNGRIVIPVGDEHGIQDLILVTKDENGKISKKSMMPVRFVPLIRK